MNNKPNQTHKTTAPVRVKEPKPKIPGVELQLIGKRVKLTNNDWTKAITGKLLKIEKYLYVVETAQGTVIVNKHSVGTISGAKEETQE